MISIPDTSFDEIKILLKDIHDIEENFEVFNTSEKDEVFEKGIIEYFNSDKIKKVAVLGIDIYKYSKYPIPMQHYIPFLFKLIYNNTIVSILESQEFLFQHYNPDIFKKHLISTGDGGFQLLKTPLHAILFAIYFEANLRSYNSYSYYPRLRNYIGELTLRYTLTYENVYNFENDFYGPAIINNARILSKDKLNRFLIDSNSYSWFLNKLNGIESLKSIPLKFISKLDDFKNYDDKKLKGKNIFYYEPKSKHESFDTIHISKLQTIEAKESFFEIYNLNIQVKMQQRNDSENRSKIFMMSLGNLNTEGINI